MVKRLLNKPLPFLILTVIAVIAFVAVNTIDTSKILGAKTEDSPPENETATLVTITPNPTASSSPTEQPRLTKSAYKIALYGDSMVDTMGDMKYLNDALVKKYPETNFNLFNYGIGAQNVKVGFERLNLKFAYQNRNYEPIGKIGADAIIVGTFAYNPFEQHNTALYKNYLTQLILQLKQTGAPVYLLVEVAPLKENFGKGSQGINWPPDLALKQSQNIEEQLLAAKSVAQSLNTPVIDVYSLTKGKPTYTSVDDGIHPSYDGHVFTANLITQKLELK